MRLSSVRVNVGTQLNMLSNTELSLHLHNAKTTIRATGVLCIWQHCTLQLAQVFSGICTKLPSRLMGNNLCVSVSSVTALHNKATDRLG